MHFVSCPSNFRTEIASAERISCHEIKINREIRDTARDFVMQKLFPFWDEKLTHLSHTQKFPERAFELTLSIPFPFLLGIYWRKMHILPHPLKNILKRSVPFRSVSILSFILIVMNEICSSCATYNINNIVFSLNIMLFLLFCKNGNNSSFLALDFHVLLFKTNGVMKKDWKCTKPLLGII